MSDILAMAIIFAAILAGVAWRTIAPYQAKVKEMEEKGEDPIKFLARFKLTAIFIVIGMAVITLGIMQNLTIDPNEALALFIPMFFAGYGANGFVNSFIKPKEESTPTPV